MRWKAFASQDFLQDEKNTGGQRIVMTPMEAQECIKWACTLRSPEWVACNLFMVPPAVNPNPWGKKGKGGGLSFAPEDEDDWSDEEYTAVPQFEEVEQWRVVYKDKVMVRAEPSVTGLIIYSFPPGTVVKVSHRKGDWVRLHSSEGFEAKAPEAWMLADGTAKGVGVLLEKIGSEMLALTAEATRTNPFSVGRRIKTHGLVNNADLNEVKGTLLEEVRNNVWKVRLDQDLGEHLLKEANMKTLVGGMVSNSEKAGQSKAIDAEVHPFCIAGTFNDWVPQDMRWDVVLGCFAHEVELDKDDIGKFGISQGIATGVRWKTRPVKQWTIGRKGGRYQIRLYVKDDRCSPSKIEWAELK